MIDALQNSFGTFNKKDYPNEVEVLPLKGMVIFPGVIQPITIGREKSIEIVNKVSEGDKFIALFTQKDPNKDEIKTKSQLAEFGTIAIIHRIIKVPDGTVRAIVQSLDKIKLKKMTESDPHWKAEIEVIKTRKSKGSKIDALIKNLHALFQKAVELAPYIPPDIIFAAMNIKDPFKLAYLIGSNMPVKVEEQLEILGEKTLEATLKKVTKLLTKEIYMLELAKQIQSNVQESIGKNQKEYFLREQLSIIRKELGEGKDEDDEIEELKEKLAKLKLPEEVKEETDRELKRLERIPSASAEYSVVRTYLDWIIKLPWSKYSKERLDLEKAGKVLNKDHYGQEKLKERILEYLAVYKRKKKVLKNKEIKNPILCFVGPPGVGKTSFGKSIASALNREFVRMSLGGVRDESEIRGHRRTYVGAIPGRIIQGLARAGTKNPVFMLDEIDKMGTSFQGDPGAALLEVLDPAQNDDFRDHYLDLPFDLSNIMFITTANVLDTIPHALRDRMEIIEISSYTTEEKKNIAINHLITKQLKEHALDKKSVKFDDEAVIDVITKYTRESGVRNLERTIGTICRKSITKLEKENKKSLKVDQKLVKEFLKKPRFTPEKEVKERMTEPGIAIGLSWSQVGGSILFIEANMAKAKRSLKLTGQLGDVMKESAQTALSYIYAHAKEIGFDPKLIEESEIHLHVPAGGIPKDGPSAGITIATTFASLLTGRKVKSDVAMTGEITLRGNVLPIGGLKEKALAAHRVGIKNIIISKMNKPDYEEDIPDFVKKDIKFHIVSKMDEVLEIALEPKVKPKKKAKK